MILGCKFIVFCAMWIAKISDLSLGLQWSPFTGRGWIVLLDRSHEVATKWEGFVRPTASWPKKNYGKRNGPIFDYFLQLSLCQRCSSKDGVSFSVLFSSSIQFVWRCLASCSSYFHIGNSVLSIPALPWDALRMCRTVTLPVWTSSFWERLENGFATLQRGSRLGRCSGLRILQPTRACHIRRCRLPT